MDPLISGCLHQSVVWHQFILNTLVCTVDIHESMDPLTWIPQYKGCESHDSNLEPYDSMVKTGEGWWI